MMNTLYLTAEEQKMFEALSEELKEGWEVEDETGAFEDSDAHRKMRMRFFRVHDPKLQDFYEKAKQCGSEQELGTLVQEMDLSGVDDADLMELFFVLGPSPLRAVILHLLNSIETDADIEDVGHLTVLRNSLLTSLQKK